MSRNINHLIDTLKKGTLNTDLLDVSKLLIDDFADKLDLQLLNKLISQMMLMLSETSLSLQESNRIIAKRENELKKYSENLELMVEEKVKEISDSQMATIFALVKLAESRDDDTGVHIERTAQLCKLFAEKLTSIPQFKDIVDHVFIDNIYKSCPLHDIGKVGIPDAILQKPGRLTWEEFEIMKSHVSIGKNTLKEVSDRYKKSSFLKMGMEIAGNHHEKWDGSGYPQGISGTSIPLSARIMALVDTYDALRSKRVYKDAFTHEKSLSIIKKGKASHFDPLLVDVFIKHQKEIMALYDHFI